MMQNFGIFAMNKSVNDIWYQNARNEKQNLKFIFLILVL